MKKLLFKGSGVAIVTPFTKDGVDYDKLEELIEFQIKEKTDAIIICGTTGESSTMPDAEHKAVIKFAVQKTAGRIPVIAGTGSNDTRHCIELSNYAEGVGVDGLLLVTPYYNKTTQKGLIEHYTMIANSVKSPIILYNVPSRTGLNILPETVKALANVENIVAIKEACGNINQITELASVCGDSIYIYSGNDDHIVPMLSVGAVGVISVVANILPRDTHDMVMKYLEGDVKGSMELQLKMFDLVKSLFIEVSPMPVKEALNILGFNVGICRPPLTTMLEKNIETLKKSLINYGLKAV
ncbi:MAG: 4-hydroxy-tetrahydrodipicolinate synthase [Deltaproteobacteria bacterium]